MTFAEDVKTGMNPFRDKLNEVLNYLKTYFKNPVEGLKHLPDWDWPVLLIFQASATAICGALSGLISLKISLLLSGLIIAPITSVITTIIVTGFFYYTFVFFFHREIPLRKIYTIIVLSHLPALVLYILSGLVPPIGVLGFTITALLLTVGLTENTQIDRQKIVKLVWSIYALYVIFWIFNMISIKRETDHYKDLASPESIEMLKKEMDGK